MDFEGLFRKSWGQFAKDLVSWALFALVGMLLACTIVLIPTVIRGGAKSTLDNIRTGKGPDFGELWNFTGYLQMLLLLVVGGCLVMIGYMLLVVPGVILNVWWLYAIFYIADRDMGFWEAMGASRESVSRTGFFNHLLIFIIINVLGWIGGAACGLGALLTLPLSLIIMAYVYLDAIGEQKL